MRVIWYGMANMMLWLVIPKIRASLKFSITDVLSNDQSFIDAFSGLTCTSLAPSSHL